MSRKSLPQNDKDRYKDPARELSKLLDEPEIGGPSKDKPPLHLAAELGGIAGAAAANAEQDLGVEGAGDRDPTSQNSSPDSDSDSAPKDAAEVESDDDDDAGDEDGELSLDEINAIHAGRIVPQLAAIEKLINEDRQRFDLAHPDGKKRWSVDRARRAALANVGLYEKASLNRISRKDLRAIFIAAHEQRREQQGLQPTKADTEALSDEVQAALDRLLEEYSVVKKSRTTHMSRKAKLNPNVALTQAEIDRLEQKTEGWDIDGPRGDNWDIAKRYRDREKAATTSAPASSAPDTTPAPKPPVASPPVPPPDHDADVRDVFGPLLDDDPEVEQSFNDLERARAAFARLEARRQARLGDYKGLRALHGYSAARDAYHAARVHYGQTYFRLSGDLDAARNDTERNAIVLSYLLEEDAQLRQETNRQVERTPAQRFISWMNEGSRLKRFSKYALLGGIGGAITLATGAIGLGIGAGVGLGASSALRYMRGYASQGIRGMEESAIDSREADFERVFDQRMRLLGGTGDLENASDIFAGYFNADTKREQRKNQRAVGTGILSVGAGAVVGHLLHAGGNKLFGHDKTSIPGRGTKPTGGLPGEGDSPFHKPTGGGYFTDRGASFKDYLHPNAQKVADMPRPVSLHDMTNWHDTVTVRPGEGWHETMKSMGIPDDRWSRVLHEAGPKLRDQGWAYFDHGHGEWRIRHAGQLSPEAIQTLKDASAKFGYAFRRP